MHWNVADCPGDSLMTHWNPRQVCQSVRLTTMKGGASNHTSCEPEKFQAESKQHLARGLEFFPELTPSDVGSLKAEQ